MNREDLKVGKKYKSKLTGDTKIVKYISKECVLYEIDGKEIPSFIETFLGKHEPIPEPVELYYIWRVKKIDSAHWYIPDGYFNKSGYTTTKTRTALFYCWQDASKQIIRTINPIDKDGNEYTWEQVAEMGVEV